MRLRIGIGMARMSTLCHKSLSLASYIIYGNALVAALWTDAQLRALQPHA
jgi:hypothetical protein